MLDINKLYRDGFDTFILDKLYIKRLWSLVKKEDWVNLDDYKGISIKTIPSWMAPKGGDEYKSPTKYKRVFDDLILEKKYNGNLDICYDIEINKIEMWDGSDDKDYYHSHTKLDGDFFILIYLSDFDKWDENNGGGISFGVRDLTKDDDWLYSNMESEYIEGKEEKTFYPDNGRIVYGNNLNPRQVHRPKRLTEEAKEIGVKRITFLITINLVVNKETANSIYKKTPLINDKDEVVGSI